ncbi:MAG TPA: terpene cyclase/mutase family protein [Candidatus Anammoximicrobium sp.]|nr:terpene cyclase/mutase family protein [Candidatus Anammoximicrobium sp.]
MHERFWIFCFGVTIAVGAGSDLTGAETARPDAPDYEQMVSRAIGFLATKGQAEDGSFSSQAGPAVTALVATALMRHGRTPSDPLVANSLAYVEQFVRSDGGVFGTGSLYANYETSVAILCLTEANKDGRYTEKLNKADAYIRGLQWDEGEDKDPSDPAYGGAGYGKHKRPDLSNTQFFMDALQAMGTDVNDEAVKRALTFVSRCQNLETEHNTTPFAAKNPDGGFYYTPAAGGSSMAGTTPSGGLRSYGSMTYAGLKSMIYAGLSADDPRVKAAVKWIKMHYDLKSNPGMGDQGLYYYYHTFAKTLDAMKQDVFVDQRGVQHDWRAELRAELARRQLPDGSWVNEADRWMEGDPNLVTAYALLALSYCKPQPQAESR